MGSVEVAHPTHMHISIISPYMHCHRSEHFPEFFEGWREKQQQESGIGPSSSETPAVRFVDIGCGFGGLLVK